MNRQIVATVSLMTGLLSLSSPSFGQGCVAAHGTGTITALSGVYTIGDAAFSDFGIMTTVSIKL